MRWNDQQSDKVSRSLGRYLAQLAIVFGAQFAAGRLADVLQTLSKGGIGPVWPAAGIAVGALLLWGYSVWPGIAAGAFLLGFLGPLPHWAAAVYATGTTLASLLAVFLLRRIADFEHSLPRLRDVIALIVLGAFGSSVVSASIGASTFYVAQIRGWPGFASAWLIYWLGDSTGVLVVTPFVLTLRTLFRIRDRHRIAEGIALLFLLTVTCFTIFGDLPLLQVKLHVLAFAVLPFVMWAAIRFGIGTTALSVVLIATIATVETELGAGPFATNTPVLNAVLLDAFFAIVSVTGLTLAAAIGEREQAELGRERLARERAETEARLRYSAIVESSEDAIASGTLDGIIVSWNAGAQRMYGYTEAEAVGKPITILIPPELPDGENKILETVKAGGHVEHFETIRVTKTGKKINVSLTISPIKDSSGRTVGISGIARDITERKRAEEALVKLNRTLEAQSALLKSSEDLLKIFVKNVPAAVAMLDRDMRYLQVSDRWCSDYLPGRAQILGRSHYELFPDMPERWKEVHRRCLAGETLRAEEDRWDGQDGPHWARWEVRPWKTAEDTVGGILILAEDITRRKQMEEALLGMSRKLIDAQEQERARIARELHDDIGQRLALLAVELQLVQDKLVNVPPGVLKRMRDLGGQTEEISTDVHNLSHELHSSKPELLGVSAAMKSWCKEFSNRQKMQIDFQSGDVSSLPQEISLCLFRVLQEAVNNADRYSGVKRIDVQLREEPGVIHLVVSDSGKGFDVAAVELGQGLGLTSMRERVRLVNGTIAIESKPMAGTTIRVRVPIASNTMPERLVG